MILKWQNVLDLKIQTTDLKIKREEERSRQAEEQRLKDEECNMKKLVDKTRKDAIFKAYLDKKKQMQEEIGGVLGTLSLSHFFLLILK